MEEKANFLTQISILNMHEHETHTVYGVHCTHTNMGQLINFNYW